MSNNVIDITVVPGLPPAALRTLLSGPEIQGAILRTFGQGNFPSDSHLLDVIPAACSQGKVLVNVTQCPRGRVNMERYEAGRLLAQRGVIGGGDITPEAAYTKLAWLLAIGENVHQSMQANLRGELSPP